MSSVRMPIQGFFTPGSGWFWDAPIHSTWLASGKNSLAYDFGQHKFLPLDDGTDHSAIGGLGGLVARFNDGATTDNTGYLIKSSGGLLTGSDTFTVAIYCRYHGVNADTTNEHTLYDEWETAQTNVLFRYDPAANVLEGFANLGGTKSVTGGSSTIENGDWETFCLIYDGVNLQIYRAGVASGSPTAATGAVNTGTSKTTWCNQISGADLDGGAWDVAMATAQNRAWTSAQVAEWASDPFAPFRPRTNFPVYLFDTSVPAVGGNPLASSLMTMGVGF